MTDYKITGKKRFILKMLELTTELDKSEKPIECAIIVNDLEKLLDEYVSKQLILHCVIKCDGCNKKLTGVYAPQGDSKYCRECA